MNQGALKPAKFETPVFSIDRAHNVRDEELRCQNMEDGWHFDINSAKYEFKKNKIRLGGREIEFEAMQGEKGTDWFDLGNQSTSTAACWKFKTLHKALGTSGKLWFYLTGTKHKDSPDNKTETQVVDIPWGESRAISIDASSTWELSYTQFNGKRIDFIAADSSNPYISISTAGNKVLIKALPGY